VGYFAGHGNDGIFNSACNKVLKSSLRDRVLLRVLMHFRVFPNEMH